MRLPKRPQPLHATDTVEYWRVARVAQYLDVSGKRVYQLIAQGILAAVRLGPRQVRVTRASLGEYLAAQPAVTPHADREACDA
jgi:excisionase family DNA binding protein